MQNQSLEELLAGGITGQKELEKIGDLARTEDNRLRLLEAGILPRLAQILVELNDLESERLCARAIGNLCYEQKEQAMKVCENKKVIDKLIKLMSSTSIDAQKNGAGTLGNLAWDNEKLQKELSVENGQVVKTLYNLLASDNEMVLFMTLRAITNLIGNENSQREAYEKAGVIDRLVEVFHKGVEDDNARAEVLNVLSTLLTPETAEKVTSRVGLLQQLIDSISQDDDDTVRQYAAELLIPLAESDKTRAALGQHLPKLEKLVFVSPPLPLLRPLVRSLAYLALADELMERMFQSHKHYIELCQHSDAEISVSATTILGNISRRDTFCRQLMEEGAFNALFKVLDEGDSRGQNMALTALRNLSIIPEHRARLIEEGILRKLIWTCCSRNAHVLFSNVSLIRHFINAGPQVAVRFVKEGGIGPLMPFANELKEEHKRIVYETARVLAVLASLHPEPNVIVKDCGVHPLFELITSNFAILHTEGLRGLKALAPFEEHRKEMIKRIPDLVKLLSEKEEQNLILLLEIFQLLVSTDEEAKKALAESSEFKVGLENLSQSSSGVKVKAEELSALLN